MCQTPVQWAETSPHHAATWYAAEAAEAGMEDGRGKRKSDWTRDTGGLTGRERDDAEGALYVG